MDTPLDGKKLKASERQIQGTHYKDMPVQPSEYIYRNGLNWYVGNVIKYVSRYDKKGQDVADLHKAIHYIELLIEELSNE